MNAIGPIEASNKASYLEIRDRLMNPPSIKEKRIRDSKERKDRIDMFEMLSGFIRYDVRNSKGDEIEETPIATKEHHLTRAGRISEILEEVSKYHKVPIAVIKGPCRSPAYVRARQEVMYRIHTEIEEMSLPMIGRTMGRDHTTILYGIREHTKRLKAMGAA